jgi:transcriptional regulator with XRE-family HTH domain
MRKNGGRSVSGERRPPQARDRAIGAQLRSIRMQQTTFSLEAAAKLLQWSTATMSRIETGKRHISAEDVAAILAIYRVPVAQREGLIARAKAIDEPGWWSRPLPGVLPDLGVLASYESEAIAITDWSINLVPGLLQTYDYAKAYLLDDGVSQEDAEIIWMARLRRQQTLSKIEYAAYIGEAAVRTPFGGAAFAEQLKRLLEATKRGLGVRVVPEHRPYAGLLQSWMFLEFPDSSPIVHVELLRSGVFLHDPEVAPYAGLRGRLHKIALSTAETRDMLRKLIHQREGTG